MNACALISKELSIVTWPTVTSAGDMIRRLQGQRKGPANRPVLNCLSFLSFDGQFLDIADLYRAELHHSSFVGSELNYTILMFANLTRASFIGAKMEGVNLSSAKLTDARIPVSQLPRFRGGFARGPLLDEDDRPESRRVAGKPDSLRRLADVQKRGIIVIDESGVPMSEDQLAEYAESERTLTERGGPASKKLRKN